MAPLKKEVTVVLGDNGAGKSTLFEVLKRHPKLEKHAVVYLPQTFSLPPFTKVRETLEYVAMRRRVSNVDNEVGRVLDLVNLEEQRNKRCRALSGGMHRRLGIGLSLIGAPSVLILDEPTAGLDISQRDELLSVITTVGRETPVLMSSHIQEDLESTARRVLLLDRGKLLFDGPREAFEKHADRDARSRWGSAYRNLVSEGT